MALKSSSTVKGLSGRLSSRPQGCNSHPPKEYLDSGKTNVRCKCPKCGEVHATFMHWAGRGVPRIYCRNCRPMVSSLCDAGYNGSTWSAARSNRKSGYQAFE